MIENRNGSSPTRPHAGTSDNGKHRNYRVFLARLAAELTSVSPSRLYRLSVSIHHLPYCPALSAPDPASLDAMQTCDCRPTPVIEIEAGEHVGGING